MRFRMRTCLAVMGAVAMLGAFGADSATSIGTLIMFR